MPDPAPSEEFDLLAAELAMGTLEGEERVRALRLNLSDRAFRAAVAGWQERLSPMLEEVPNAEPSPALWSRIDALIEGGAPVPSPGHLRAWRFGALAASLAAAVLAFFLFLAPRPDQPVEIAQLLDKSGQALLLVRLDRDSGQLRVQSLGLPEDARVPELWVIPEGGTPQSLGTVSRRGVSELAAGVRNQPLLRPGSVIAVTLERAEGIPHAAPTGEILSSAPISTF